MINVLVVEDEPPIQRMICKTISELDGKSALHEEQNAVK